MERPTCKKEERVRWREAVILESAFSIRIIEKNDRSLGPIGFLVIIIMYFFFFLSLIVKTVLRCRSQVSFFFLFSQGRPCFSETASREKTKCKGGDEVHHLMASSFPMVASVGQRTLAWEPDL